MYVSEYKCKKCDSHFEVLVRGDKDIQCVECASSASLELLMCDKTQAGILEFILRRVEECQEMHGRIENLEDAVFETPELSPLEIH